MADDVRVDSLSIEIESNVKPAASAINSLASAVKKFNQAVAGGNGVKELTNIAESAKTASDALGDTPTKITAFASSLKTLSESAGGMKGLKNVAAALSDISNAIRGIDASAIQTISILASSLSNLAAISNVRIPRNLAEDIVNLGIIAEQVQDVDWSVFERMAEGLRHLEGLGEIRIPRIRGNTAQTGTVTNPAAPVISAGSNPIDGVVDDAARTGDALARLREMLNATNDLHAFAQGLTDLELLQMRLQGAYTRLQQLWEEADGDRDLRAIANTIAEIQQLEREIQTAQDTFGRFMGQLGSGFASGAGISGIIGQIRDIFSSPAHAIGWGIGKAVNVAVSAVGRLASALKNAGVAAFNASLKALQATLHGVASAATAAAKGIAAIGTFGAKVMTGVAKMEFKGLMLLPQVFSKNLVSHVASLTKRVNQLFALLGRITFYRLVRGAIKVILKGLQEGIENLYQWSKLLNGTFAQSMDRIATAANYFKNSVAAMLSPILEYFAPILDALVDKLVEVMNRVNQLLSALSGKTLYTAARKVAKEWSEAAKEAKRTILGFDEINALQDNKSKQEEDYSSLFEMRPIQTEIAAFADKLRKLFTRGKFAQIGKLLSKQINKWIDNIEWGKIGKKIGDGINALAEMYNAFMAGIDWINLGSYFAESLNNLLDTVKWGQLGRMFAQKLNALFGTLLGFVRNFRWGDAGVAFAESVWGLVDGIKWDEIGEAIGKGITGLATFVYNAALNFPWEEAAKKLASGLNTLFDNLKWETIADALNTLFNRALDGLLAFIREFEWEKHGEELRQGLVKLVKNCPVDKAIEALKETIRGILVAALPTLSDTSLMKDLGAKLADFFNGLFDNTNGFWDTVGTTANALLVGLLTIGQKFVDDFDEKQAADSINAALGNVKWSDIATNTWSLIKSAFGKAGSFVDALFHKNTDGLRGRQLADATAYNLLPLGERMAESLKEMLSNVPWPDIAKTAWEGIKSGFSVGYDFISALFGLDEKGAKNVDSKIREIGNTISRELQTIPWATIAADVWAKIKTAFSHAGNFLDALLHIDTNGLRGRALQEATDFNAMSFGSRLGATISKAIAGIDWKQFGSDFSTGATNLLNVFSDALNELTKKGKNGGNSQLETAIQNFIDGIDKPALAQAIKGSLEAVAKVIAQTFGIVLNEAFNDLFSDPTGWAEGPSFMGDPLMGDYGSAKPVGYGRADLWASKGRTLADSLADGTINELNARQSDLSTAFKNAFVDPYMIEVEGEEGFDTGSPSKRTKSLGEWVMQGFLNGIRPMWLDLLISVAKGVQELVTLVLTPLKNLVEIGIPLKMAAANTAFFDGWNTIQITSSTAVQGLVTLILQPLNNLAVIGIPSIMSLLRNGFSTGWNDINNTTVSAMSIFYRNIVNTIEALGSYIPNKFRTIFNSVVTLANSLISRVQSAMNNVIRGLNNALQINMTWTIPDWAGGGSYWWKWFPNLPTVSFGSVTYLAEGGILAHPTQIAPNVVGGEAGREAVLPLDGNTEWMDDIAERVNAYGGNEREIELLREQNDLLRQLIEKGTSVEITTGQIARANVRQNRRAGATIIPVGT